MGFFDKLKGIVKTSTADAPPPPPSAAPAPIQAVPEPEPEPTEQDCAGFDVDEDEAAFFRAMLHMESEGEFGGTDESRAEIMEQYGIRDRSHWRDVKDANYAALARKYGSFEEASQQESNWRSGEMQKHQMAQVAKAAAGGGFEAVEGVSLQAWAAINAAIIGGGNWEDLLKGAGIEKARWERVSAEWNARMARDTTFAITTVYGNAFQAASTGKYGDFAREAAAARTANRELAMAPPMTYEQYWEIYIEQAYCAKQGKDPIESLKASGLTIVDWTDLGAYFGYLWHRDATRNWDAYEAIHKRVEAKAEAKYPGVKADLDISF